MSNNPPVKLEGLFPGLSEDEAIDDNEDGKAEGHDQAYFRGDEGGSAHARVNERILKPDSNLKFSIIYCI